MAAMTLITLTQSAASGAMQDRYWLGGPGLKFPVEVTASATDGGGIVLANDDSGVYGVGGTLADAVADFRAALQDHLRALTGQTLSPDLERQLAWLNAHVETLMR